MAALTLSAKSQVQEPFLRRSQVKCQACLQTKKPDLSDNCILNIVIPKVLNLQVVSCD